MNNKKSVDNDNYNALVANLTRKIKSNTPVEEVSAIYAERGNLFFEREQYEEAIADYNKMIEYDPGNSTAYFSRAYAYAVLGDQCIAQNDKNSAQRNYQNALSDCAEAINLDKTFLDVWLLRSRLQIAIGQPETAIAGLAEAIGTGLFSTNTLAEIYLTRGDLYFNLIKNKEAFRDYNDVIKLVPENPQAYLIRANRYNTLANEFADKNDSENAKKNYLLALNDTNKALALDKSFVDALFLRARLFLSLQQPDDSISDLSTLLKRELSSSARATVYKERGDIKFSQQKEKEALKDYSNMIASVPDDPQAYFYRALKKATLGDNKAIESDIHSAQKYYRDALSDCIEAINLDNAHLDALLLRSRIQSAMGQFENAINDLTVAIDSGDPSEDTLTGLYNARADLYFNQYRNEEAFSDYAAVIKLVPENPQAYLIRANRYNTLANELADKNDSENAKKNYLLALNDTNKALELDKTSVEALFFRARLYSSLQQPDKSIADLSAALLTKDLPAFDRATIFKERGDIKFSLNKENEALEDYKKMIEVVPKNPVAYYFRADKYAMLGDQFNNINNAKKYYKLSLKDCNRAIKYDETYLDALLLRSRLQSVMNKLKDAVKGLTKSITSGLFAEINLAELYSARAEVYFNQKNYKQAFIDYSKMIELAPDNPQAYYIRASKYAFWGDQLLIDVKQKEAKEQYKNALADYNQAIGLSPERVGYYLDRAQIYLFFENWKELNCDSDKILQLDDKSHTGYFGKGIALNGLGKADEALEWFDKALEHITPENEAGKAEVYLNHAIVCEKLGRYNAALYDYDSVITLSPDDPRGFIGQGNAFFSLEDYFKSVEKFTYALDLDENSTVALSGRALSYIEVGNRYLELDDFINANEAFKNAIRDCEVALNVDNTDAYTWYYHGLALKNLMGYRNALKSLEKALSLAQTGQLPILFGIYYHLGDATRQVGMDHEKFDKKLFEKWMKKAIKVFNDGIDYLLQQPTDVNNDNLVLLYTSKGEVLKSLGVVLKRSSRFKESISYFDKSILYDQNNIRALVRKGAVFYLSKKYEEAKTTFLQALKIAKKLKIKNQPPDLFDLEYANLGLWLTRKKLNPNQQANPYCERALNVQPEIQEFRRYLNQASVLEKEFDELESAKTYFLKAAELNDNSSNAHNGVAWFIVDQLENISKDLDALSANLEIARQHADRAVTLENNNSSWLDTLGWVYFKLGQTQHAREYIEKAHSLNPYDDLIQLHLETVKKAL